MNMLWKVILGLALVVPMGAYVAGTLATSASSEPGPRQTIEIQAPTPATSPTESTRPRPARTTAPTTPSSTPGTHDSDDGVEVITPWDEVGDDHGGEHGSEHGSDDSGHGGRG